MSESDRRVATVLFSDLKGSTALGERLDPESLREVLGRYFEEMRAVLESHGGRVEKVVGDAIITLFGLDGELDDHAGRAVEAADETRRVLATLNDRLERRWDVRLVNRTGVCTGQVLVGEAGGDRWIAGEAMDLAARMEAAAPPLEVLLAAPTREAVGDRVVVAPEPDVYDSTVGAVQAFRLVAVTSPLPPWTGAGAAVRAAAGGRETRRTVTIVFSDARPVAAEGADPGPEALHEAMGRHFALARGILEQHGAVVETYMGDAVMAVFGIDRRREDDALRAVRAAWELRGIAPADDLGVRIEQRIGVNTGHLVAGDAALRQRMVTGDAVNVAARFEQAAAPGEVIIGRETAMLAGAAVGTEALTPLTLKGKAEPVPAFRVTSVSAAPAAVRMDTPMVGRDDELTTVRRSLRYAVATCTPRLVLLTGDAGVGKSRLADAVAEAAADDGAQVLRGRCLSYGAGITFWPVLEVVHGAAGIGSDDSVTEARARLAAVAGDAAVEERIASLVGVSDTVFPLPELFWAARSFLEAVARRGPLVVRLDDLHWAEDTLLDLLAELLTADAPLLLLGTGRAELLERRPELGEGRARMHLALGPLGTAEVAALLDGLIGGGLPIDAVSRIVRAAGGNPLFVEQMLSMLVDTGRIVRTGGRWRVTGDLADLAVPPSVEAVVAARVDELPDAQRAVLEPAAVAGEEFPADAVRELAADDVRDAVDEHLIALAGRQMVEELEEPDRTADHRFAHPMIRDVTYGGLLKRTRAELHERFVRWAEGTGLARDRPLEVEEVLGYHLEQAHRLRVDLGPLDRRGVELGRRAADRLGAAGRRALERGDMPAAANLLGRAAAALPQDPVPAARLLVDAGQAEMESGRLTEADAVLGRAAALASGAKAGGLASVARLERTRLAYLTGGGPGDDDVAAQAEGAIYAFTADGDEEGLATAWRLLLNVRLTGCHFGEAEAAADQIVTHATRSGNRLLVNRMLPVLAQLSLRGPMPALDAMVRCRQILADVAGDRQAEAVARRALSHLRGMWGELDDARAELRRCRADLEELGWVLDAALVCLDAGPVALLADDPAGAEAELQWSYDVLDGMGERNYLSTVAGLLGEARFRAGRLDAAEEAVAFSREVAAEGDVATQIIWRSVHGKLRARRGDGAAGVASCREAVALADGTDDLISRADALADLG
ncbi:MAG TPA: adenylate/guanylate cyclase domain-containing protein, partial [Miltoncostaea sp.]|nr:adenylate/guanylate cyclase domain-containing protein [Miltoncostaea sp.]